MSSVMFGLVGEVRPVEAFEMVNTAALRSQSGGKNVEESDDRCKLCLIKWVGSLAQSKKGEGGDNVCTLFIVIGRMLRFQKGLVTRARTYCSE